jgi:hypothetical protein
MLCQSNVTTFRPPIEQIQMKYNSPIKIAVICFTIISFVCTVYLQYQVSTDLSLYISTPVIDASITDIKVLPDVTFVKELIKVFLNIVS